MVVPSVILMSTDPFLLKALEHLSSVRFYFLDPSLVRETHQEFSKLLQAQNNILLLLDFTPDVDYLQMKFLIGLLHGLSLHHCAFCVLLFLMGLQLIFLDKS